MTYYPFINLLTKKQEELPLIIFTHRPDNLFNRLIRMRTKGEYSHVLWFHKAGNPPLTKPKVASQNWRYEEVSLFNYLDCDMEILRYGHQWDESERRMILDDIQRKIDRNGFYDILGVFGHLIGFPRINGDRLHYCSEAVWQTFKKVYGITEENDHPTPEELRTWLKNHGWEVEGVRQMSKEI